MPRNTESPTYKPQDMGQRISKARQKATMTQKELAEAIGLSQRAVSEIESGKRAPRADVLFKLCENLNLSADQIIGFEVKQRKPEGHLSHFEKKLIAAKSLPAKDKKLLTGVLEALLIKHGLEKHDRL